LQTLPVVIYNSLGWTRNEIIKIPVNVAALSVSSASTFSGDVRSQVLPSNDPTVSAKFNLFFEASVSPLGFRTYFITAGKIAAKPPKKPYQARAPPPTLTNSILQVGFDNTSQRLYSISNLESGAKAIVNQSLEWYQSDYQGYSGYGPSDAYAFTPFGFPIAVAQDPVPFTAQLGDLVDEIYQVFDRKYATQTVRVYKPSLSIGTTFARFVEIEFHLGPLPYYHEVITSFSSSIQNKQILYTDDNGFEFLLRDTTKAETIQESYYPTVYSSYIKDSVAQLSVVVDRTFGASSLNRTAGDFQLMLHRNPGALDQGGRPGLIDPTVVTSVIRVFLDTPAASPIQVRIQPYFLNFPLAVFPAAKPATTWKYVTAATFIQKPLPPNVHFLSLYSLYNSTITTTIFRLTHLFAKDERPLDYSLPVTINVQTDIFNTTVLDFGETTLTANLGTVTPIPNRTVTLQPKEIRTFIITFRT